MDTASALNLADGSLTGPQIQALEFDYQRAADRDLPSPARHPVVVVGAGPVGLTLAIDLAQCGHKVLLLDNDHRLSSGSRAICFAKRTLEIWDRLGVGNACVADENILNSTRATDFITPKSEISKLFRNSVLQLAAEHAFARRIVNSGRLSVPATLDGSVLNTADRDVFGSAMRPGAPIADVPLQHAGRPTWLLRQTGGEFVLLVFGPTLPHTLAGLQPGLKVLLIGPQDRALPQANNAAAMSLHDHLGVFFSRFDAQPGNAWLLRPDQHVCARWRSATQGDVSRAMNKALAKEAACSP